MHWISVTASVTDRLPTDADAPNGRILVCFGSEPIDKHSFDVWGNRSPYLIDPERRDPRVTHWCAIPEFLPTHGLTVAG